ncbi:MAG: CBS domain-containing protein [Gammaproteobacteria bacterium]|nr:CBS domain-containing protein [Gammaproteobacteria bacterium]
MRERQIRQLIGRTEMVTLSADASVREACRLMSEQGVSAVLIQEGEQLTGIFTERDAVKRVLAEGLDPETTRLADVMTPDVVTLTPDTWALDALRVMHEVGIRHIPVTEGEAIVGMVSIRDFIGVELQQLDITWDAS